MSEATPLLGRFAQNKTPSSWHTIIPMMLVAFSGGALLAPLTQYFTEIFCNRYYKTQNDIDDTLMPFRNCAIPEVQKMVSRAQAIIMFLTYGSTLVGAGFYGRLSDTKGRTIILRISTLGSLIHVTCNLLTAKYHETIGISLLFLGPLVRGVMAGESVLMAAVQAYISDCTPTSSRTIVFARLMASLFIGSTIGPFVSSQVIKHTGSTISVFYVALIVDLANVLYTSLFVPESNEFVLKRKLGDTSSTTTAQDTTTTKSIKFWERLNIFSALKVLFRDPPPHMNKYALPCIALADALLILVRRPPTLLYAMLKFKWTAYEGSLYYTFTSFMKLFIMIGVLPLLSKLFNKKCPKAHSSPISHQEGEEKRLKNTALFDIWMVRIGIGIDAISLALAGLANNVKIFIMAGLLQSFSMLAQPSIRGLLTTLVEPNQVGELLGAVAILDSIAMIISHLSINTIYSATVKTMPNFTFFVCAFIAGCSCFSAFMVRRNPVSENDDLADECDLHRNSTHTSSRYVENDETEPFLHIHRKRKANRAT